MAGFPSGSVTSFNTRTGAVTPGNADYLAVASGGLTGATAATRYVGGTASGAPASGTFAVGDFIIDQTAAVYVCTVAGTPGTWVKAGGGASVLVKRYQSSPTSGVTVTSTTLASFSTAWTLTGVVVAGTNQVLVRASFAYSTNTNGHDIIFSIVRAGTQVATRVLTALTGFSLQDHVMEAVDNPGPGTYTYEVQALQFTSGTLTLYNSNPSTDVNGGNSVMVADVYTP